MSDLRHFKVGDYCWMFDGNKRVYAERKPDSLSSGPPIYSGHFIRAKIVGETKMSWVVSEVFQRGEVSKFQLKFRKDGETRFEFARHGRIYTDAEREDMIWAHENRYRIVDAVKNAPIPMLRQISELLDGGKHGS